MDKTKRNMYGMLCGVAGIIFNIMLFAGKLFAGTISGAISITADAFNNLSDAGSSLITLVGFKMASQQADEKLWTCQNRICSNLSGIGNHSDHGI